MEEPENANTEQYEPYQGEAIVEKSAGSTSAYAEQAYESLFDQTAPKVTPKKSLSRFRLAIWGMWLFYSLAIIVLYIRVQGWSGLGYGMAFAAVSSPGAIALFFWKARGAQSLSRGLYLRAGNLSVAAFFANFFLLYALLKHFVSDDSALLSLALMILNACLQGGLVWMIFFKKDAPYLTN